LPRGSILAVSSADLTDSVLASIREIPGPSPPGRLKSIGGSKSDDWNGILANQALSPLWLGNSKNETKDT
jgi:hypothetical protein